MEALETAIRFHYRVANGLALFGLAQTMTVSDPTQSRQHAEESYAMLQKMGHYKTAVVEEWLNTHELPS